MQTATHPDFRTRMIIAADSAALIVPFVAWITNNYLVCIWSLNILVVLVTLHALHTGVKTFQKWQGKWECLETCWMLALSCTACLMMIVLLIDWYIKTGWNLIGIYDNMLWSYMHYCAARAIGAFHKCVWKHG